MIALLLLALAAAPQLPVEGRPEAAVRVLIYEDLQCSDCAASARCWTSTCCRATAPRLPSYTAISRWPNMPGRARAALAGRFFAEKDPKMALEFRRHLLGSLRQINAANFKEKLAAFAESRGIPGSQAVAALDNAAYAAAVEKDFQEGVARGVSKTPTVLVNGKPFIETFTLEEISKGIDQALAEAH